MTDKKLKTKKRLLQQRVSFNNDMTMGGEPDNPFCVKFYLCLFWTIQIATPKNGIKTIIRQFIYWMYCRLYKGDKPVFANSCSF